MPLNQLKNIRIDFSLFDENSKPKAKLPVFIQYYEVAKNQWISIYVATLVKGSLSIEETTKSRAKALVSFFNILKDNQIPELRIVAQENLYALEKFQVLTSMYAFHYDEKESLLHFDFGTAYLLNEEFLKTQAGFKDFIVVTSPYSFANQRQNEKEITRLDNALKKCTGEQDGLSDAFAKANKKISEQEVANDKLAKDFEEVTNQKAELNNRYSSLEADFKKLQKEASDCKKAIEKADADLVKEKSSKGKLAGQILDLKNQITSCKNSFKEAQKKIKRLTPYETKFHNLKTEFDELTATYNHANKEADKHASQYKELQEAYDNLAKEKEDFEEKLDICSSEKEQCYVSRASLNEKTTRLAADLSEVRKGVIQKESQITTLNAKIDELSRGVEFETRPMPVSGVYTNIVNEIQMAETLNNSNFRLSNIRLKIKTLVNRDKDGVNMQFLNHETAKEVNGNAISEVVMDIESVSNSVSESTNLPSLIGFTETAVRRMLSNLGLRLNPVYQKTTGEIPAGESFKQSPSVNSEIENNQLITVIFSKNG